MMGVLYTLSVQYSIRPNEASDLHALEQLMVELQQHLVGIDPLKRQRCEQGYGKTYVDALLQKVARGEGHIFVAEEAGDIVGCCVCVLERQSKSDLLEVHPVLDGRILELIVRRDRRGRGIGSTLMQTAEQYLKEKRCDAVRVEVFSPNTDARHLYEKLGYAERMVDMLKVF